MVANINDFYRIKAVDYYNQRNLPARDSNNLFKSNSPNGIENPKNATVTFIGEDNTIKKVDIIHWLNNFQLTEAINNPEFTLKRAAIRKHAAVNSYKKYGNNIEIKY